MFWVFNSVSLKPTVEGNINENVTARIRVIIDHNIEILLNYISSLSIMLKLPIVPKYTFKIFV